MITKGQTVYVLEPDKSFTETTVSNVGNKVYKVFYDDGLLFFKKDRQYRGGYVNEGINHKTKASKQRLYESKAALDAFLEQDAAVEWLRHHIEPWKKYSISTLNKIKEAITSDASFGKGGFVIHRKEESNV